MNAMMELSRRMNRFSAVAAVGMLLFGCSKKPDVKASVSELEKAFPAAAAVTPQAIEPAATPAPVDQADPNAYVSAALSAARANDYQSGVIALQQAQQAKGVSANQLMTLEQAKQAMVRDLLARAERGDAQAKAALKAIEKTHSQ